MKSVIVRLQEYEVQASTAEKEVICVLLESPESVMGCSIQELAKRTFSSASTIIRLCRKNGFEGYRDFQQSLISEMAVRKQSEGELKTELSKKDKIEDVISKVTYKNIVSLEKTVKLLDEQVLDQCVNLLINSKSIGFFGMGSSLLVARDAYLKFLRINKPCFTCDDWHAQLLYAQNMTEQDVAVMISYSGLTEEMIQCAATARQQGAMIIAITRFEDSKLAQLADYKLYVAATELIVRTGAMSSRISQLNVIDILYTAYLQRSVERDLHQFQNTHIRKAGHGQEKQNSRIGKAGER